MIAQDESLTDALFGTFFGEKETATSANDQDTISAANETETIPERLSRTDLITAWMDNLESAYALIESPSKCIFKLSRGKAPLLTIEVMRRQLASSSMTRVRGLADFGLNCDAVCRDLSKRLGCQGKVRTLHPDTEEEVLLFEGHWALKLEDLFSGADAASRGSGTKDLMYRLPKNAIKVIVYGKEGSVGNRKKEFNKKEVASYGNKNQIDKGGRKKQVDKKGGRQEEVGITTFARF